MVHNLSSCLTLVLVFCWVDVVQIRSVSLCVLTLLLSLLSVGNSQLSVPGDGGKLALVHVSLALLHLSQLGLGVHF